MGGTGITAKPVFVH